MDRRHALTLLAVPALVAGGASIGWAAAPSEPVVVVREALAAGTEPVGAPDRDLGVNRVTVMPGAELAPHHHPGTQVSYIDQGTLTYTVLTGKVRVMRGPSDDPTKVRTIAAGETGKIRAGQWIVEQPWVSHQAANRGTDPVVILLATLFRDGRPAAIPD